MTDQYIAGEGKTVREGRTDRFVALVERGIDPKDAAKEVGVSLSSLKQTGVLARACRALLERVEQEKLLDKKTFDGIARARALELMMQDEDLKVALGAVRAVIGTGPQVAVQINTNLRANPEVLESLKTLQLEVDDEEG